MLRVAPNWVAERTPALFPRFRGLAVRDDRRADIDFAFPSRTAALTIGRFIER